MLSKTKELLSICSSCEEVRPRSRSHNYVPKNEVLYDFNSFTKDIDLPDYDIAVVGPEYLSSRHSIFVIRKGYSRCTGNTIVILDHTYQEVFSCKNKLFSNNEILYNNNGKPILNTKVNVRSTKLKKDNVNVMINISDDQNDNSKYGILNGYSSNTECIYDVEYLNLITGRIENLEIISMKKRSQGYFTSYSVYWTNPYSNNSRRIMIAKITRHSDMSTLTVEIAPRVDSAYIFAIALAINKAFKMEY